MTKTISYSDFLKEGALKESRVKQKTDIELEAKSFRIIPEDIVSDHDEKAFWKKLRYFFRTGERPKGRNGILVPLLIAPYLRQGNWDTDYPYYLAGEKDISQSIESLLDYLLSDLFEENEAKVLRLQKVRLISYFKQAIPKAESAIPIEDASKKAFKLLLKLDVHDEEGVRFKEDVKRLKDAFPTEGFLLDFHHELPLLMIRQKLLQIESNRTVYKDLIKEKRDALLDKLKMNQSKIGKESPAKGFEFAEDMIALDHVQEITPKSGSDQLASDRIDRIEALAAQLDNTLDNKENHAHLLVNQELEKQYRWKTLFTHSKVTFVGLKEAFELAEQLFDQNIQSFTRVLVAIRKADLELRNKYEPDVHDDYFDHFKWFKLEEEELNLFPPVLLFTNSVHLLQENMVEFSNLLVSNKPIKVIALTNRTIHASNPNIDWEEASMTYRQELAAIALSHRNVFTLQCATDRPVGLLKGLRSSIQSTAPSLVHILVTLPKEHVTISFLKINAAAAGRYFPYLQYDPNKGTEWGSRFDIEDNSQANRNWPVYSFKHQAADGNDVEADFAFTYSDYKAMTLEKVEELMIVPESMVNEYLVPIAEYLELGQNEQTGKVPYIWLIDEDNAMVRAAVPYMWVASCLERQDFWNFIQELGGVNSFHVKTYLEKAKNEWNGQRATEINELSIQHAEELSEMKRTAAGEAMEQLSAVLLNLEELNTRPRVKKESVIAEVKSKEERSDDPKEDEQEQETEQAIDEDQTAWIETFKCTSCNDCTDRFPAVFTYNEEKQAFVKDATKGTYEELVMAAESCPAECIHPGMPLNPEESNLEELKERAAKFN